MRERQKHSGEKESQNNEDKWVRKGKLTEKKKSLWSFHWRKSTALSVFNEEIYGS
jgi:hypothetical protein